MPQAEVADLMQALGQHVLQKAAHELVAGKACVEQAARGALPVTDGDAGRIEANDAAVGDGYAVDIAPQILEHGVGAVASVSPRSPGEREVRCRAWCLRRRPRRAVLATDPATGLASALRYPLLALQHARDGHGISSIVAAGTLIPRLCFGSKWRPDGLGAQPKEGNMV